MIAVAGINHSSAGFSDLSGFSSRFKPAANRPDLLCGQVWLHTCNRIELYADLRLHCHKSAEKQLLSLFGLTEKPAGFFVYLEEKAALHLLRVASGIESAVTGEDQILHQLKKSYQAALEQQASSPLLNKLFHTAFETGKEVRTATSINKGNCSVAAIAASLAETYTNNPANTKNPSILIIGAGETGALVADILVKKGFTNIRIWNRTFSKAEKIAATPGITAIPVESIGEEYLKSDISIVAITKKEPLIDFHFPTLELKKNKLVLDLSMPFQVPLSVQQANCRLYNLETINTLKAEQEEKRKSAIEDANRIILSKMGEWKEWLQQQWISQTLRQWKIVFEEIRQRELQQFIKKYPGSNPGILTELSTSLSATFLKQLAWTFRQQEHKSEEWKQWAGLDKSTESTLLN